MPAPTHDHPPDDHHAADDHGTHDHGTHDHGAHDNGTHDHGTHQHGAHDHGAQAGIAADASVRAARVNDLAAVGRVQEAVWRSAYASVLSAQVLDHLDAAAFARGWRGAVESPPSERHRLLVACAGLQVVGLAAVGPSGDPDATPDSGELLVLGVHPDARRQGHGSRLLNAAIAALQDTGATSVRAWLLGAEEPTRAFLAGAGLEPDGAFRSRVVDPDGRTAREVRLPAALAAPDAGSPQ